MVFNVGNDKSTKSESAAGTASPSCSRPDKSLITERLKQAIAAGGGNKKVASRTGIPLSTINNYTTGESEPKLSAAALISAVCGVSLNWLAYGEESKNISGLKSQDGSGAEPLNQIALAVYESIHESGCLVSTETFNSLLISFYDFHVEMVGLENLSPGDKKSQKLKALLVAALKGSHK